jgi:hypothetical protein
MISTNGKPCPLLPYSAARTVQPSVPLAVFAML